MQFSTQGQFAASCDYLRVRMASAIDPVSVATQFFHGLCHHARCVNVFVQNENPYRAA